MAIPRYLLGAISLAESGRWDANRRANVAWPWTVTSGGQGRFFDTKAEAVAEVEILITEGVSNIDVGCMQVNLYYHGGAFETLEEAFDPRTNTTYAASYLKNMYLITGDWTAAAGYYHSQTPSRNGPYKEKVRAFWRQQGGAVATARGRSEDPARGPKAMGPSRVDYTRMAQLNKRFKARREAKRLAASGGDRGNSLAAFRNQQLNAWREARSRGVGTQHLIAMRQAELQLKRKREMDRRLKGDPKTRFAAKRTQQLRDWRLRIASRGVGPGMETVAEAG
ncbi:MAG: transglycosylase SLT domain-containing protein, partial [Proteobacteria bacterium]|nr:transglycosylase SLT domain-containing protein [Pseudomonadota bacterium]